MRDLEPVRTTEEFLKFARRLNSCITTLENKEHFKDLGAGMLYSVVKTKLPERILERYYGWLENRYRPTNLKSLSKWAMLQAKYTSAAEDVTGIIRTELKKEENNVKFHPRRRSNTKPFVTTERNPKDSEKSKCIKCSKDHELTKCDEFQKAFLRSPWRLAQSKQLCFRCLRSGHQSEDCKHGNACQEPDCDNNFHHLLHYHQKETSSVTDKKTEIQKRKEEQPALDKLKENEDSNYVKKSTSHKIVLRTASVILVNGNKRMKSIGFLDDGRKGTYIWEDIAEYLGLKGEMASLKILTLTGSEILDTQRVQVGTESRDGTFSQIIRAWTKQSITPSLKVITQNNHKKQWPYPNSIKFPNVSHHGSVDSLIGVDAIDLHKTIEEVQGGRGQLIARRTPFGWTL